MSESAEDYTSIFSPQDAFGVRKMAKVWFRFIRVRKKDEKTIDKEPVAGGDG